MSFEQMVVSFSAPALCGIKPASLFSMRADIFGEGHEKLDSWNSSFDKDGIRIMPIKKRQNLILFFVYNRRLLEEKYIEAEAFCYLLKKGYPVEKGFDKVFEELIFRLEKYTVFPHEIGIFLGYPVHDVRLFEKKKGSGFSYSGYWKVYKDIDQAVAMMRLYRKCSEDCLEFLRGGCSVPQCADKYKSMRRIAS